MTEKSLFNSGGGRIENKKIYTQERKKTMKKVTSLLLALVMALALAVPAFAEVTEIDPAEGGSKTQNVEATYTAPKDTPAAKVYYFTVTWAKNDKMDLTYTGEDTTYTWDGSTMKYIKKVNNESEVGWKGSAGYKVTITNQSNDDISATTSATANFKLKAAVVGNETATLESAAKGIDFTDTDTKGAASTKVTTYTFSNDINNTATAPTADDVQDNGKVIAGTISVTVTHA